MKKMLTKLKMSLTNNIGLKFLAVLIALVLWLAIVNVNDPEKTITVSNIPISVTNESAITSRDMVYNVKSEQYLNITVSGKRSIVSNLSAEDFRATASLKELSKVNSIPVDVTTKNASLGRKITIVKQSAQTILVDVENVEEKDNYLKDEIKEEILQTWLLSIQERLLTAMWQGLAQCLQTKLQ